MRVLAVDPGEKRIGIAISDPSGTLAAPREVIKHISRSEDAARIARIAEENGCALIVVGAALHWDGGESESSRRAKKLAAAIRALASIPVVLWDESGSTQAAARIAIAHGARRKARRGPMDDAAAAVILQSYLDSHRGSDV